MALGTVPFNNIQRQKDIHKPLFLKDLYRKRVPSPFNILRSGRISSALSKPISELEPGESMRINRVRTTVNASVDKIKAELKYISASIW